MVKFFIDYEGFIVYKCPKCGSFNINIKNYDNFICLDCKHNSSINYFSSSVMEGLKKVQDFIIYVSNEDFEKILKEHSKDIKKLWGEILVPEELAKKIVNKKFSSIN